MDRFVGLARLEWWANDSTCLGEYDIDISVTLDAAGTWRATGQHCAALDSSQLDGWDFLVGMDPHFAIAFPGEERGRLIVRVDQVKDGTLVLTEAPGWVGS